MTAFEQLDAIIEDYVNTNGEKTTELYVSRPFASKLEEESGCKIYSGAGDADIEQGKRFVMQHKEIDIYEVEDSKEGVWHLGVEKGSMSKPDQQKDETTKATLLECLSWLKSWVNTAYKGIMFGGSIAEACRLTKQGREFDAGVLIGLEMAEQIAKGNLTQAYATRLLDLMSRWREGLEEMPDTSIKTSGDVRYPSNQKPIPTGAYEKIDYS